MKKQERRFFAFAGKGFNQELEKSVPIPTY